MTEPQKENIRELLQRVIRPTGEAPVQTAVLQIYQKTGSRYVTAAGNLPAAVAPADRYRFRTGSMTKPFTATVLLQLVEEGKCRLEDPFLDLLPAAQRSLLQDILFVGEENHSREISVSQLLRHRSGLPDYFADDPDFIYQLLSSPERPWSWTAVIDRYQRSGLHRQGKFAPGRGFHYSDTNYLLLAVLIEALTGQPFHQALEERILQPLGLEDTYLEYYQPEIKDRPMLYPYFGPHALEATNTSFDWGGGGLVSTGRDLHLFMRALLSGQLFSSTDTLRIMQTISVPRGTQEKSAGYALGLEAKQIDDVIFWGHNSAYGALMYYHADLSLGIVLTLHQTAAVARAEWLLRSVLRILTN